MNSLVSFRSVPQGRVKTRPVSRGVNSQEKTVEWKKILRSTYGGIYVDEEQ